MNINDFINFEKNYFEPMLARVQQSSEEQRLQWRKETIAQRTERISLEVFDMLEGVVKYGPLKGLKLQSDTWWGKSDLGSMLLGLYEKEILDYIETVHVNDFNAFIDIGAADGYYACGLLASGKVNRAICFEKSELGREIIKSNWIRNGEKGELKVYGEANINSISALSPEDLSKSLVLVDIEGFEFELLTDDFMSALSTCTIIIEVHNWVDDFIPKYERFLNDAWKFFDIESFQRVDRTTSHLPELRDFTDDNRLLLVSERRPCLMRFLKLTPKDSKLS
ncbi:hypothetical protein [Pectobacterium aquaticum]|uniref:Methyltransferase FkbM domain-containing protein n=1 Tax=Pectobacterium aquaticum TaxID=2204145 RepID=A0AA93AK24_9GAMM|nr:hypothetical protein [Pectobacterium aquaticum]RRO02308.1 hypothetical protein DMB83_009870 [Pectobacterium aquaticum]RRO07576.1 hypothetical protein DMB85_012590 [Pectobacterium aquaticum]RRO16486.1 hypothetical protein DMB84_015365 [Pectobacterium aquaticum]